jgi:heme A synthase
MIADASARGLRPVRRLGYASLALAFTQIVFGAIVRISGSGLGCGDHWPTCMGRWFPPLDRPDLIIEITHRYIAAGLSVALVLFAMTMWRRRGDEQIAGPGGVLRPVVAAVVLVVLAAILGAVTVKMALNGLIVVAHLALAMTLLATLVVAAVRAGGFGAAAIEPESASGRTARAAIAAVGVTFVVLLVGALTANTPGAPMACQGFPLCTGGIVGSGPQYIHIAHRVLAFLLALHLIGMTMGIRARREGPMIRRAAGIALAAILVQIVIAAALVEMHLPASVRAMHQGAGTLIWISVVTLAVLARRASADGAAAGAARA